VRERIAGTTVAYVAVFPVDVDALTLLYATVSVIGTHAALWTTGA